jgi:hypothetical protein
MLGDNVELSREDVAFIGGSPGINSLAELQFISITVHYVKTILLQKYTIQVT